MEVKKQCQIKFSNRFSAFEKLSSSEEIDRTWKNVEENNKTPATGGIYLYELQQHKPCFD
jgi:predicted 3-demethylubiquinone-9 3-methyltransferase (glyoxalase superfamily)